MIIKGESPKLLFIKGDNIRTCISNEQNKSKPLKDELSARYNFNSNKFNRYIVCVPKMTLAINTFITAGLSSVVGIIVSHPIDTMKTLNQMSIIHIPSKQACKHSLYYYVPSMRLLSRPLKYKLFNGLMYPIKSNFILNGSIFYLHEYFYNKSNDHYISGLLTGIVTSPINNYYELYKINSQCLKDSTIINKQPIPKLKGLLSTLIRDSLGNSIYFGSYYNMNKYLDSNFISGGLAGLISWIPTYWIDTIKTRIQSNKCATYKLAFYEGNLMNGFRFCAIRSFLYNAIVFQCYEKLNNSSCKT